MKLSVVKRDYLRRSDGRQIHPYDVLADWVRRMREAWDADKDSPVMPLALTLQEWTATRNYFEQFTYEASVAPDGEQDPLRGILVAFGIEIPEVEIDPEGDDPE